MSHPSPHPQDAGRVERPQGWEALGVGRWEVTNKGNKRVGRGGWDGKKWNTQASNSKYSTISESVATVLYGNSHCHVSQVWANWPGSSSVFYKYEKSKQLCCKIIAGIVPSLCRSQKPFLHVFNIYVLAFNSGPARPPSTNATWKRSTLLGSRLPSFTPAQTAYLARCYHYFIVKAAFQLRVPILSSLNNRRGWRKHRGSQQLWFPWPSRACLTASTRQQWFPARAARENPLESL